MKVQAIVERVTYVNGQVDVGYNLTVDSADLGSRGCNAAEKVIHVAGPGARSETEVMRFVHAALGEQFPNATGIEIARRLPASAQRERVEVVEL